MTSYKDNNLTNQKLIQFKIGLERYLKEGKNLDPIFEKLDNIDITIQPTNYFNLYHPSLIGNTALNLAYDCQREKGLDAVLSRGADFTIKNQDQLTILHWILQENYKTGLHFSKLRSKLNSSCIDIILSAHIDTNDPRNPCDSNGMSHFHVACMANDIELVKFFLDNDVAIDHAINNNSPYFAGFTGLHLAIRCLNLQVTRILLSGGASTFIKNAEGMTAFHMVLDNYLNFTDDTFYCFDHISDLPLISANIEIAKLLLETVSKRDTLVIDDTGLSRLHLACITMDSSVAEKLAWEDINHSISIESPLCPGYTALHLAALANTNTVEVLVKKGADLLAKDANKITPLDLCIQRYRKEEQIYRILSLNPLYQGIDFTSEIKLLDFILAMKDFEQFKMFLNNHTDSAKVSLPKDAPLWPGFTPLHLVVLFSSLGNFYKKNSKESCWTWKNSCNRETYHEIVDEKYLHMTGELHNRNGNMIIAQDLYNFTPVHLSFRLGKISKVVDLLLTLHDKLGTPFDLVDDENLSLLHIACSTGDSISVEKLLLHSKNVNLAYKGKAIRFLIESGWTPLHLAVAYCNFEIIKMLLKNGADVNRQDAHGVTPIHLMILNNRDPVSYPLPMQNLEECVIEGIGLSHLHAACFAKNKDAIKKLVDGGSDVNLAISSDPKIADRSFEFIRLVKYLGCTSLEMLDPFCFSVSSKGLRKVRSNCINVLLQHGVNIFVGNFKLLTEIFHNLNNFRCFFRDFKENANLQNLVESAIGLTKVHAACFFRDIEWLERLMNDANVNVNAQLSMNLPKYAGFTPLHIAVLNMFVEDVKIEKELINVLLENGADITILNKKEQTPLHLAHMVYVERLRDLKIDSHTYLLQAITFLKAQKDFNINPTNTNGLSHFHIACNLGDASVVKKFLEHGGLDVNQATDFFNLEYISCTAGFTPLHFAAMSDKKYIAVDSQLNIVDMLLKSGADLNCQSSRGNTPLHVTNRYEIFERLARNGADVNQRNIDGHTPLGHLLTYKMDISSRVVVSVDQVVNWLKCGCHYNAFNIITEEGFIGLSFDVLSFQELQELIKIIATSMPHVMQPDDAGRTVIHNAASTKYDHGKNLSEIEYASLIELLANTFGCDIDSQDNLGKTALHLAAELGNARGISALLMIGADVNVIDERGKTALAYHVGPCTTCPIWKRVGTPNLCDMFVVLAEHVHKLQLCQLEVCQTNITCISSEFISTLKIKDERFHKDLGEINNLKFETSDLTLRNLLSEIDVVADYPTMAQFKKDAIAKFFEQDNITQFRKKFYINAGLLNLQYRKALKRTSLIEEATISLDVLAEFPVPVLCSDIIFGLLSNYDLSRLIASTNDCEDMEDYANIDPHCRSRNQEYDDLLRVLPQQTKKNSV